MLTKMEPFKIFRGLKQQANIFTMIKADSIAPHTLHAAILLGVLGILLDPFANVKKKEATKMRLTVPAEPQSVWGRDGKC